MAMLQTQGFAAEFFGVLTVIFVLVYAWFQYKFSYWSRRSVQGPKPTFPFGNIRDVVLRKEQFFQPYCDSYKDYKHLPYVGMYCFHRPVLCINDIEIVKLIMIKEFDHFQSHGIFSEGSDPLANHLFNIAGERWKNLRLKMSAAFTPGKLKNSYPLVQECASDAMNYLELMDLNEKSVNFSDFYEMYTMKIIASVGFGVDCNGFKDSRNTEFFVRAHEYFEPRSLYWTFVRALAFFAPDLSLKLKFKRFSPEMINFFYNLVKESVDYRQKNSFKRNDFLQTMLELKNADDKEDAKQRNPFAFTMDDLAANTMLFLVAGYETSATVGQFAAYELALNPRVQAKAREEVNRVLAEHQGQCTYEAQSEMTYMNMVFEETMRKYPPMRALFRKCNKDLKLPDNDLTIEKGTTVFLPCQAIQMDSEIYENPEKFVPERFLPEEKAKRHPCHWMPFGEGPRKCLGLRQGYIQMKMLIISILQRYEMVLDERTLVPMTLRPSVLSGTPEGGIWIKLKRLTAPVE